MIISWIFYGLFYKYLIRFESVELASKVICRVKVGLDQEDIGVPHIQSCCTVLQGTFNPEKRSTHWQYMTLCKIVRNDPNQISISHITTLCSHVLAEEKEHMQKEYMDAIPIGVVKFAPHLLLLSNAASHPRYVIVPTRKLFWWVHKAPISFSIQISEAKTGKAMGLQLLSLSLVILIFCSCDTSGRDIFLNTIGGQRPRTTGSIGGQTNRYSIPFSSFWTQTQLQAVLFTGGCLGSACSPSGTGAREEPHVSLAGGVSGRYVEF